MSPDVPADAALPAAQPAYFDAELGLVYDTQEDRLREECGVFAVFGADDASVITALGLHALQHRGQEGCGIVSLDDAGFHHVERHMGLVGENFSANAARPVAERLPGRVAIGHTRYATQGGRILRNVQPLYADLNCGGFAIAHNGNLTNARALREHLVEDGAIFQSTSDTECILQLVARSRRARVADRFIDALSRVEGAYALVCLTGSTLLAARDPAGIRPLVLGDLHGAPVLASETCALDLIGAQFVRSVENGEVLAITRGPDGQAVIESHKPFAAQVSRPCVFEFVYFARPDSIVEGRSVYAVRKRMGQRLALETAVDVDVIVPVPDSGVPAALGYAEASRLPYEMGIIRSHYVGRTFIQPKQAARESGVMMKHAANRAVLKGKRVLLVDDSIVRGTTCKQIVQLIRDAGAAEVHFRSASPQIRFGDFYGIDMPEANKLLAHQYHGDEAAMAAALGADSLGFLSVDGLYWALGDMVRDAERPQFADHCFTGKYPTRLVDHDADKAAKDLQLSFLVDA
jgi:amidophosphoribosyltransferase